MYRNKTIITNWSQQEDQQLVRGVEKYGKKSHWDEIANEIPHKTALMCYLRWHSHGNRAMWKTRKTKVFIIIASNFCHNLCFVTIREVTWILL